MSEHAAFDRRYVAAAAYASSTFLRISQFNSSLLKQVVGWLKEIQ